MLHLLAYQKLIGYIDGSILSPLPTMVTNNVIASNPFYITWLSTDQRALILIQSSLPKEEMAETLGHKTTGAVWCTLEKVSSTVGEFGRKFKHICDQLTAIGHPVEEYDKIHWFLYGLGSSFETFSTIQRLIMPRPTFRDLISQVESHELFLSLLNGSTSPSVAFHSVTSSGRGNSTNSRGRSSSHGGSLRNSFAQRSSPALDANLAQAFHAQCNVVNDSPDWYVDSGASAHMTSSSAHMDSASTYSGNDRVSFDNGNVFSISHIGTSWIPPTINLLDVLSVPQLTKNLIYFSKLTKDNHVDVLFFDDVFIIQNRNSKEPLAQGRHLIHYDLWGPSPIVSKDGYRYYVIFVDDFSKFRWFYPLKAKSNFYGVLLAFGNLAQTQFLCKIKVFQSDGETEFVNERVRNLFSGNGTHQRLSYPYSPQQNGRAERKHRHITETSLAMMFNAHVPAFMWTHAFDLLLILLTATPSVKLLLSTYYDGIPISTDHPTEISSQSCDQPGLIIHTNEEHGGKTGHGGIQPITRARSMGIMQTDVRLNEKEEQPNLMIEDFTAQSYLWQLLKNPESGMEDIPSTSS
ncbi:retrovirus-related pol polyprotein from transposon TNT 1-94 [Tanacetum coccineum]